MFHLFTLHKHMFKALSRSPRKSESLGEQGVHWKWIDTTRVADVLLACPPLLRCFPHDCLSLCSLVLFILSAKLVPLHLTPSTPFSLTLPPQHAFLQLSAWIPAFCPSIKIGQPCGSCPQVLVIYFAVAGCCAHIQSVTAAGPQSWRSQTTAKWGTADFLLTIDI